MALGGNIRAKPNALSGNPGIESGNQSQYKLGLRVPRGGRAMNSVIALISMGLVVALPTAAWAGANCKAHPKSDWMKEADAKAKIEAEGYKIAKFKVEGNCYEIYGT